MSPEKCSDLLPALGDISSWETSSPSSWHQGPFPSLCTGLLGQFQFLGGHVFSSLTPRGAAVSLLNTMTFASPVAMVVRGTGTFVWLLLNFLALKSFPSLAFSSQKTLSHTSTSSLLTAWHILFFGFYPMEASAGHGSFPLLCLCPYVQFQATGACFTGFLVYRTWKAERKMTNIGEM